MTEICEKTHLKYSCEICDYNTSHKNDFEKHLHTKKHFEQKVGISIPKNPKKSQLYFCESCDFSTCNKTDYARHCETLKCKSVTKTQKNAKNAKKRIDINSIPSIESTKYACKCGKEFKARSSLWRHQKHPMQCAGESNDAKLMELVISNQKQHDETIVKIIPSTANKLEGQYCVRNLKNILFINISRYLLKNSILALGTHSLPLNCKQL